MIRDLVAPSTSAVGLSKGFTLVELLVSMVMVMVILAGLYSNFMMQLRVQTNQSTTVSAVEDLRLVSQIMGAQLKLARNICWNATNGLVYEPLGAVAMTSCAAVDASWGAFRFSAGTAATGGTICWDRPNDVTGCQELLRGLNTATGLIVAPTANADLTVIRTVTLTSNYQSLERQTKNMSVTFDVWPRN